MSPTHFIRLNAPSYAVAPAARYLLHLPYPSRCGGFPPPLAPDTMRVTSLTHRFDRVQPVLQHRLESHDAWRIVRYRAHAIKHNVKPHQSLVLARRILATMTHCLDQRLARHIHRPLEQILLDHSINLPHRILAMTPHRLYNPD
mgnify:CR=1 FL=1